MTTIEGVMFLVNRSQEANALGTKILTRQVRVAILAFVAEQVAAERGACEAIAQDICDQIMYGEPDPECVGPDDGLNTTELGQLNAAMVIRDAIRARGNP